MFSPVLPHITEEIYQDYYAEKEGKKSIHISGYLDIGTDSDNDILSDGDKVVDLVSNVRKFKSENNVSLKTFIKDITITSNFTEFLKQAEIDIKAVCSINEIKYKDGNEFNVEFGEVIPDEPENK